MASMGCSVSTSDLASTATLLSDTTPPTHIKAMCGSAQTFQEMGLPITTCPRNTALPTTDIRLSMDGLS